MEYTQMKAAGPAQWNPSTQTVTEQGAPIGVRSLIAGVDALVMAGHRLQEAVNNLEQRLGPIMVGGAGADKNTAVNGLHSPQSHITSEIQGQVGRLHGLADSLDQISARLDI